MYEVGTVSLYNMQFQAVRHQINVRSKGHRRIISFVPVISWTVEAQSPVTKKLDHADRPEIVPLIRGRKTGVQACSNV